MKNMITRRMLSCLWTALAAAVSLTVPDAVYGSHRACCFADGTCSMQTPSDCEALGGTPQGPGTACQGDNDLDGVDDGCACAAPPADMVAWWPLDGFPQVDLNNGNNAGAINSPDLLTGEYVANSYCFVPSHLTGSSCRTTRP